MNPAPELSAGSRRKRTAWIAAGILVIALLVYALSPRLLTAAGSQLIHADPLQRADVIVVLAPFLDRVREAAELYGQGYAPLVIIATEWRDIGEQELIDRGVIKSREDKRRDALIALGVRPDAVVILDGQTDSTADEARLFAEWASSRPIRRAIVVTSPPHTYRSRLTFIRAVENLDVEILVHPSSRHPFRGDSWWRTRRTLRDGLIEWQKVIYYRLIELPRMTPPRSKAPFPGPS
jgi:uncharacterized SAM-binding protein YcdF (DUF218 family)